MMNRYFEYMVVVMSESGEVKSHTLFYDVEYDGNDESVAVRAFKQARPLLGQSVELRRREVMSWETIQKRNVISDDVISRRKAE
jgi:hypothetical protein